MVTEKNKPYNHNPESHWEVVRRCLTILRQTQQEPANKETLIQAVYQSVGKEAYGGVSGAELNKRFENDCHRIRNKLNIQLKFDHKTQTYTIESWDTPLFDLSNAHLKTLAFLTDTFQTDSPNGPAVKALINDLLARLPTERHAIYHHARGILPDIELRLRDNEPITEKVWEAVQYSYEYKQQLEFDYRSSAHADQQTRHHLVEPHNFYFNTRGHYILAAFCLFNTGPNGPWHPNALNNYRVSRIVPNSIKVLPKKFIPRTLTIKRYEAIYELAPEIARLGVSPQPELINLPKIIELDGGWVRVEGKTHNIFELSRNLLYYGANCRVLGGKELREEIKKLVNGLNEIYR